jgi:hypothetical protein
MLMQVSARYIWMTMNVNANVGKIYLDDYEW